ncbi:MAG: hypothetical protein KFB97_01175 [Cyanobium sp. M30B3]|nr:MAG: hypothetical protein KFB97_01175 [Cyanobium sp. M30B3]
MPPSGPWLSRQNAALKLKGHGVTPDVAGGRVRLRATMPPRPTDPLGAEPKQHRISTGLAYPDQAPESLQLAEQPDGVSGRQGVRLTRKWWGKQRRRGPSADDSWKVDNDAPASRTSKRTAAGHAVLRLQGCHDNVGQTGLGWRTTLP